MLEILPSAGSILVVAAHPDDEVLGCGGTIARIAAQGGKVNVMFLGDGVTSRGEDAATARAAIGRREQAARSAMAILGGNAPRFGNLPDNGLDQVPLIEICKRIESVVNELKPAVVFTHHGGDLNIDHQLVHRAVVTACRPMPQSSVRAVLCFETLSSTEWSSAAIGELFRPTLHINIADFLATKLRALDCYAEELRDFPHARSSENVANVARVRGASVGFDAAEAFVVVREIVG